MGDMDSSQFQKNERPNEYQVRFDVSGEISLTVTAESVEEARQKANEMLDDDDFGLELDQVDDVRIGHVWKSHPMFLVIRDGQKMQVTILKEGDLPRQPDERGF